MFNKVKKFGSKLFGETGPSSNGKDTHDERSGSMSRSPFSLKSLSKSAVMDMETENKGSFTRKTLANSSNQLNVEGSSGSRSALPPVQVNSSFTQQQQAARSPAAIGGMMSPTNTGRRKSTPAALDMALRTAEGKAAIEELIKGEGKKQMVFGQYFGGPAKPGAAGAGAAADKGSTRFNKVPGMAGTGPAMFDKVISTVPEDEDTDIAPVQSSPSSTSTHAHVASPMASPHAPAAAGITAMPASPTLAASPRPAVKRPMDSVSSFQDSHQAPVPAPVQPAARPAPPPAPSQPMPMQVEEEPPPGKRTKMLALAQQLPTGMTRKYWSLSDYSIVRKMYTGYASTVYQATCKKSLEQVALKVYHMENLCELNHYQVFREVRVHAGLQHQHIIALFCAFQEGNDVVLVQEYAEGGDLYRLLHKNGGRLSERQAVEMVLHPFLLALHYLHTHGIMHRDIKPENVLFTEHRVLKLADFGLAIDLNEERAVTRAGTLDYMAPEVLRCPPKNLPQENKNNAALHYNNSVDAWAVGVFAYELIVGFPPFAGESQLDSVDKIIHSTPEFPEKVSELAKAFIIAALKKHPGDRPSVMEMLHHPWIRTYQRRTSVRIPQAARRRSSVSYGPGQSAHLPSSIEEGPLPGGPQNVDNMTPDEIEDMIKRLQMAKHHAGAMSGMMQSKMI